MTASISLCSKAPKGLAFEIADHLLIRGWADLHDFLAEVRLDHGVEDEEYEEVIAFHTGVNRQCRLIVWRNKDAVFVQPLLGRTQRFGSVCDALENLIPAKHVLLTDIKEVYWPTLQCVSKTQVM
jgi:hypothetical protein